MRRIQLFACSLILGLTACGGGGGGGDSGSSGSTRSPVPPQVGLTYSGSVAGATVDATSASSLASNVIGSSGAATGSSLLSGVSAQGDSAPASGPQPTGAIGLGRRLAQAIRGDALAGAARSGSALAGATFSQSIPCDSGSVNMSGTVSDSNGTGTVSIDYVDCRTGSDTINGPGSLRIDAFDQTNRIITDGTLSFTRVRFTGPGFNSDLSGTLRTQVAVGSQAPWCHSSGCGIETLTQNIDRKSVV